MIALGRVAVLAGGGGRTGTLAPAGASAPLRVGLEEKGDTHSVKAHGRRARDIPRGSIRRHTRQDGETEHSAAVSIDKCS